MHRIGTTAALMWLIWSTGTAHAATEGWDLYTSMRKINVLLPEQEALWAGTEGGVFRFDLIDSSYTTYTTLQGLAGNNVLSMVRDKTGTLWFGTDGEGLSQFVEGKGFVATYTEFQGDRINVLYAYEDKLFVGTGKNGISVFIPDRQEIKESYHLLGTFPRNVEVFALTVFNGQLWAGTAKGVAFASLDQPNLLDPNSWTSTALMRGVYGLVSSDSVIYVAGDRGVYSMQDGKWLWEKFILKTTGLAQTHGELVAVTRKGLFRRQDDEWVQDQTLPEAIALIASAPDSGLWIGIEEDGLVYRKGDQGYVVEPKIGPPGNVFTDLTVDPQGVLWAATSRRDEAFEGVYRFDGTTWSQYKWSGAQRSSAVVAVKADRRGRIWVGTWGKGAILLEDEGTPDISADLDTLINQYNSPLNPTEDLSFVVVNGFAQDQAGNMWMLNYMSETSMLSTLVTPLVVVDDLPVIEESQVFTLDDGLPGGECSAVAADSAGLIWFGTRNAGFAVIDPKGTPFSKEDDQVTRFSLGSPGELTSNNVQDIAVDRKGVVWVATDDGVHALTGSVVPGKGYVVEHWEVYRKAEGLGSSIVNAVLVDEANNKWFGTAEGLSRLSAQDGSIVTYTRANSGLVEDNIQALAMDRRHGRLWIGTARGLNVFRTSTAAGRFNASTIRAFPNPFIASESGQRVSFGDLPDHAVVQIFTAAGEQVRVVQPDSPAGRWAYWDGGNEAGFLVGSGIYLYVVRAPSGILFTGKLAVVR